MPNKIPYHKPPGMASPAKLYERQDSRQADKNFYAGSRWRDLRKSFLKRNPLCACGCGELAVDVDHKIDRKLRPDLAYDESNLQGLTKACHNAKRAIK
jgi:5-methylcytosine-specific restriction endonuclease McrA